MFFNGEHLVPLTEVVEEPDNPTFKNPRAPTIEEDEAQFVPVKHDFDITFDRPVFTGKASNLLFVSIMFDFLTTNHLYQIWFSFRNFQVEEFERWKSGKVKKNKDGTKRVITKPRLKGQIRPEFIEKHKLSRHSTPEEYMDIGFV